ncbi:M13-type metalloendopeptidase [Convivina praedatoris]|uniref:Neutral endopeptidase n=1 Tax=Convivina praedatoris TaxID=2880963 RepID=A0ABN8HER5_9LACO|nr:M13-type metalloendopeptidase [Convivina sp. LMG 32447]CAH1855978.1 Neutral endopeptidase [Convivina sp. LMG 32447]CAH1856487.1 Neutral endopeptidase [Convivina sp. LMG 32447]CAH1857318.1 Neutral endopeptidase [Convivina sp. LMG 32447]
MVRLQNDFYEAINGDWIDQATIPADKPATGGFYDLIEDIEQLERQELADFESGKKPIPATLKNFVAFHKLTSNWNQRQQGIQQIVTQYLAPLQEITNWSAWQTNAGQLIKDAYTTELAFGISPDSKNTAINELWLTAPDIILPDTTSYDDPESSQQLLAVWSKMVKEILVKVGFDQATADQMVDQALAFDHLIANRSSSNEEMSDYWKNYHPTDLVDLQKQLPEYDLSATLTEILDSSVEKVIISDAKFWDKAAEIYQAKNFEAIKAWTMIQAVLEIAPFLSNDLRVLAGQYQRTLSGTAEASEPQKSAFRQAHAFFASVVGLWYGENFFGPQAKADVTKMVKSIIKVYEQRFEHNDWLTPATLEKAKVKLNALTIKVGYPDFIPDYLVNRTVDPEQSLVDNIIRFSKEAVTYHLSKWHQKPNAEVWGMSADTVNAYYSPDFNQIVFPAAILQAPFYQLNQSASANFGGIGTVIAHEITHAFDTNGARFDEHGNLHEWWQPSDFKNFEARTKLIEEQFDGLESAGAEINGHLTVSENVADLGGISAALTAAQADPEFNVHDFFENQAQIWRQKASDDYLKLLASIDVHAPAKLRVNVPVTNFDLFFDTYQVQKRDGMWREPADRVQIW